MIGVRGVIKNTKVQKPKFKKKSENFDQYDQYETQVKKKHHDKSLYRMLKNEENDVD